PPDELPKILDYTEAVELLSHSLNIPEPDWLVGPEDAVYICPPQEDIDDLISFYRHRRAGIPYTSESWDCDNAASEAKVLADIWSYQYYDGIHAAILVAKAYVKIDGNYALLCPE